MNDRYWQTDKALEYLKITEDILYSDLPAYAAMFSLADVQGKTVLEVGSFLGDRARELKHWAKVVVGVDVNPNFVKSAQLRYGGIEGLSFYLVKEEQPFPLAEKGDQYDVVLIPFVHPVIEDGDVIENLIRKSYEVLKGGGKIIILGLNPKAFEPHLRFVSYRLKLDGEYKDSNPFRNTLITNAGEEVLLQDYARTSKTMHSYLQQVGFINTKDIDLDRKSFLSEILETTEKELKEKRSIDLLDELDAPLHQLFYAEKA